MSEREGGSSESRTSGLRLVKEQPGLPREVLVIREGLTVGRDPSCTITIDDPAVEWLHARVCRAENGDGRLVMKCQTPAARITGPGGTAVAEVVLRPPCSFGVGPARFTVRGERYSPESQTLARCPRCLEPLGDVGGQKAQCPQCEMALFRWPWPVQDDRHSYWLPARVGDYEVERVVGEGGMGIVLYAVGRENGRPAAIKIPKSHFSAGDEWWRRFEKEVAALRNLEHANIVKLLDHGTDRNLCWLAMEWIAGQTLASRIEATGGAGVDVPRAITWLVQICDGLKYLHERGVVHRDLKPGNILITDDGQVKLADFGVAQVRRDAAAPTLSVTQTTATGAVGTLGWMAPEVERGKPSCASDVYAFGLIWHAMVYGRRPALGEKVCVKGLPWACKRVLKRCLSQEPSRRPSIAVVREALTTWQRRHRSSVDRAFIALRILPAFLLSRTTLVHVVRKAAEAGDTDAMVKLGRLYAEGRGVAQDYGEAAKWFRKAAEQGHAGAQYNLGVCYANGQGVAQDTSEAVTRDRKAWEKPGAGAFPGLAESNRRRWLRAAWKYGPRIALWMTVVTITISLVLRPSWFPVTWYRIGANLGFAGAQYNLGLCYANGQGVAQDYAWAVKWFRKAAEQGLAKAQYDLGVCYYYGRGVAQDYAEAVKWYRKAAEQGDAEAQNNLGECYANGEGVPKDDNEAVKWFRKAAEQGNDKAQYNLGVCYHNGNGVARDYAEAVKWFRKAAAQGYAEARDELRKRGLEQHPVAR